MEEELKDVKHQERVKNTKIQIKCNDNIQETKTFRENISLSQNTHEELEDSKEEEA